MLKDVVPGTCEADSAKDVVPGTCEADNAKDVVLGTCEAGGSIKPGAQAPGKSKKERARAREAGGSAVARFTGWGLILFG